MTEVDVGISYTHLTITNSLPSEQSPILDPEFDDRTVDQESRESLREVAESEAATEEQNEAEGEDGPSTKANLFSAGYQSYTQHFADTATPSLVTESPELNSAEPASLPPILPSVPAAMKSLSRMPLKKPKLENIVFPAVVAALNLKQLQNNGNCNSNNDNMQQNDIGFITASSNNNANSSLATYKCGECNSVIKNISNLEAHMRRHLQYKPYRCAHCTYQGYDENDVERHISRRHPSALTRVNFKPIGEQERSVQEFIRNCKMLSEAAANGNGASSDSSPFAASISLAKNGFGGSSAQSDAFDAASAPLNFVNRSIFANNVASRSRKPSFAAPSMLHQLLNNGSSNGNSSSYRDRSLNQVKRESDAELSLFASRANGTGNCVSTTSKQRQNNTMSSIALVNCVFCGDSFVYSIPAVIAHVKSHLQLTNGYTCAFCDGAFSSVPSVSENQSANCNNGNAETFPTFDKLSTHMIEAHACDGKASASEIEDMLQTVGSYLPTELTNVVEQGLSFADNCAPLTIKCNLCSTLVPWQCRELRAHTKQHRGYLPFACSHCDESFASSRAAFVHSQQEHATDAALIVIGCKPHFREEISREQESVFESCFPSLNIQNIEALKAYPRGTHFRKGTTAFIEPTAPEFDETTACSGPNNAEAADDEDSDEDSESEFFAVNNDDDEADFKQQAKIPSAICLICRSSIRKSASSFIAHAKVHLYYKPLKCDHCQFRHASVAKSLQHNARFHSNQPVNVTYLPVANIVGQIKEMKAKCFGQAATFDYNSDALLEKLILDEEKVLIKFAMASSSRRSVEGFSPFGTPRNANGADCSLPANGNGRNNESNATTSILQNIIFGNLRSRLAEQLKGNASMPKQAALSIAANGGQARQQPMTMQPDPATSPSGSTSESGAADQSKKVCSVCNTAIANNPSSFENHACKHLDYKPYYCQYCHYQSYIRGKVTRHIQQVHHGMPIKITHQPMLGAKENIHAMKLKCFPFLSAQEAVAGGTALTATSADEITNIMTNLQQSASQPDAGTLQSYAGMITNVLMPHRHELVGNSDNGHGISSNGVHRSNPSSPVADVSPRMQMKCQLCGATLSIATANAASASQLIDDHLQSHIISKYYHCPICTYQTTYLIRAKQHVLSAHPSLNDVRILCCPPEGTRGLEQLRRKCFGSLAESFFGRLLTAHKQNANATNVQHSNASYSSFDAGQGIELSDCETTAAQHDDAASLPENPLKAAINSMLANNLKHFNAAMSAASLPSPLASAAALVSRHKQPASNVAFAGKMDQTTNAFQAKRNCSLCGATVASDGISLHVRKHLDYKPYQCSYCKYKSTAEAEVKQHMLVHHKDAPAKVVYHPERMQLSLMQSLCFPTNSLATASSATHESLRLQQQEQLQQHRAQNGSSFQANPGVASSASSPATATQTSYAADANNSTSLSGMKKLICKLCSNTIADNPKSVGIHVKNHLNYKPFRCPYCKYMSCEQSKARRHVEHVHSVSGDSIQIEVDDAIKEKITEMKARCFPNLGAGAAAGELYQQNASPANVTAMAGSTEFLYRAAMELKEEQSVSPPKLQQAIDFHPLESPHSAQFVADENAQLCAGLEDGFECKLCEQRFPPESVDYHVRSHLGKPVKCAHCPTRFWPNDKAIATHIRCAHPNMPLQVVKISGPMANGGNDTQFLLQKQRCFPVLCSDDSMEDNLPLSKFMAAAGLSATELLTNAFVNNIRRSSIQSTATSSSNQEEESQLSSLLANHSRQAEGHQINTACTAMRKPVDPGKTNCHLCEQALAANNNSMDVHAKNHLNYKPHQCGYCDYRSCIVGKVKRHVDNVHRGQEARIISFNYTSAKMKEIFQEMRLACFPQDSSSAADASGQRAAELKQSKERLLQTLDQLRGRLSAEIQALASTKDFDEQTSGHDVAAIVLNDQSSTHVAGASNGLNLSSNLDDQSEFDMTGELCIADDLVSNGSADLAETSNASSANGGSALLAAGNGGKVVCCICSSAVADNPSSLGLHVRNHLDYKPFQCNLCEYRSCIQAKVKRHLRNVHKSASEDMMTYCPVPDIRQKVTEMKLRCFPKVAEAGELAVTTNYQHTAHGNLQAYFSQLESTSDDSFPHNGQQVTKNLDSINAYLDAVLGPADECKTREMPSDQEVEVVTTGQDEDNNDNGELDEFMGDSTVCQLCFEEVQCDSAVKIEHLQTHAQDNEYRCQYCPFSTFLRPNIVTHIVAMHPGMAMKATAVVTRDKAIAFQKLSEACFPAALTDDGSQPLAVDQDGEQTEEFDAGYGDQEQFVTVEEMDSSEYHEIVDNNDDEDAHLQLPSEVSCQLCPALLQNDECELIEHCRQHMQMPHFRCALCNFVHGDSALVKDHIRTQHSGQSMKIVSIPADLNGDEAVWRFKCFPEFAEDLEELEEFAEEIEEDDSNEGSPNSFLFSGLAHKATSSSDQHGPRYVCNMCKVPVSMYASSLYVHVKNHMGYKPYECGYCEYCSPVKSKVRRHIQNSHKGEQIQINYNPTPGIDHEVIRWKRLCFPDVTSFATLTNDKVPCQVCQTDVADTLLSKSVHAKNHMDAKPYHCGYCSYRSCLRGEARRHLLRQHNGLATNIKFVESEVVDKQSVDAMILRCFQESSTRSRNVSPNQPTSVITPNALNATVIRNHAGVIQRSTAWSAASSSPAADDDKLQIMPSLCASPLSARLVEDSFDQRRAVKPLGAPLSRAYREWYCCYCTFSSNSKYTVKQHCLLAHPGNVVDVADVACKS